MTPGVALKLGNVADGTTVFGDKPICAASQVWLVSKTRADPQNVIDANVNNAASTVAKPITGSNHLHNNQADQRSTMRWRATSAPRRAEAVKAAARSASLVSTLLDSNAWSTLSGWFWWQRVPAWHSNLHH